jgi:hypothetical protein
MSWMKTRNARYAVIQARWVGRPAECFPVTYDDEEALRAIIAGSSIFACGIASHEKALALAQDAVSITNGTNNLLGTGICESAKLRGNRCSKTEEVERASGLDKAWKAMSDLTRQAIAAAILVTYSKNIFSGLLRAFIGV